MPDRAARRVLDAWIDRLKPAEERLALARWAVARDATEENRAAVEEALRALERTMGDPLGFARVEQSLAERIDDPVLHRALACLSLRLLPYRLPRSDRLLAIEADLATEFARYRAEVGGRPLAAYEVERTLRTSRDAATLEATWRAAIHGGTRVAETVREATRLRNEHARALGAADFRAQRLACEEVDAVDLDRFLRALEEGTDEAWRVEKARIDEGLASRFGCRADALRPWHYGDVFFQSLPPDGDGADGLADADPVALMHRTFEGVGLDVRSAFDRSDLWPRDGKNPHAFCTHVDRQGDVRVLANVVPSERSVRTMLHEFGHAAYFLYLDFDLPWNLVRPPHPCVTEGVAMLFDRLVFDPLWRERVAGRVPDAEGRARARADLLAFVRWGLVVSRFEEHLYADPDGDLDRVWWDLVERLQGIPRPDPLPVGAWAAKIHVACYPVYYHGYLLGQAVASQLSRHLRHGLGSPLVDDPQAGRWLVDAVFAPSASLRWDRLLAEATGEAPTAGALLAEIVETPNAV